jgi:hypothetical protein
MELYSDAEDYDVDDDIEEIEAIGAEDPAVIATAADATIGGEDDDEDADAEADVEVEADIGIELVDVGRQAEGRGLSKIFRRVVRVPEAERRTSNYMSKFEVTEAISIRTQQIDNGSPHFCAAADIVGIFDARKIAEIEFLKGRSPLLLRRKIGERIVKEGTESIVCEYYEYWNISKEMKYGTLATLE